MKRIIVVICSLFTQLMISQEAETNCFKCNYEFKEFYYVRMKYVDDSGLVYMAGLTESNDLLLTKEAHTFLTNFYDTGYYTPNLQFTYKRMVKYCGDLFFNMLNDTKSYYTKDLFFSKQISDKSMVKNIKLKDGTDIEFNISKLKRCFFLLWIKAMKT